MSADGYPRITLTFNLNNDEVRASYSRDYKQSPWITRLDMLKDSINLLQEEYDAIQNDLALHDKQSGETKE